MPERVASGVDFRAQASAGAAKTLGVGLPYISRSNYATVGGQAGGGPVYALGLGVLGNNVVVGDTGVNPANSQNIS